MQQPDGGEIVFWRRETCAGKAGHEGARPDVEPLGQTGDGRGVGGQANEGFDEEPGIRRRIGQRVEDRPLNPGDSTRGRLANHMAEAAPPGGRGDVDNLANTRGAEPEQHLRGGGVVLGDEGHGRDPGELPDQMPQRLDLLRFTPVHRNQDGVNRALPYDPHGVRNRVAVHHRKTAAARGIDSRPLDR
jgi:hypothetical protein